MLPPHLITDKIKKKKQHRKTNSKPTDEEVEKENLKFL